MLCKVTVENIIFTQSMEANAHLSKMGAKLHSQIEDYFSPTSTIGEH